VMRRRSAPSTEPVGMRNASFVWDAGFVVLLGLLLWWPCRQLVNDVQFWNEVIAGTISGAIGISVVFPFDTAKARLQTSDGHAYRGTFDLLRKTVEGEGFTSLYSGLASPAVGMGLIFASCFGTYELVTRLLVGGETGLPTPAWVQLLAGFCSGVVSSIPRSACEKVKTLMQVQQSSSGKPLYQTSLHCAVAVVTQEGPSGLFESFFATALREGLQQLIYFYVASATRSLLAPVIPASVLPLFAGAAPGMATWLPPFICIDVVKSRLESAPKGRYRGFWACAVDIYRTEPASVWFRGLSAALLRGAGMHATIFLVHDHVMQALATRLS